MITRSIERSSGEAITGQTFLQSMSRLVSKKPSPQTHNNKLRYFHKRRAEKEKETFLIGNYAT